MDDLFGFAGEIRLLRERMAGIEDAIGGCRKRELSGVEATNRANGSDYNLFNRMPSARSAPI